MEGATAALDTPAIILLAFYQASSSFGFRSAEFAFPLYFIDLFTGTLLPASLYGFVTTLFAILFSGSVGGLTDRFNAHRLRLVRIFILAQKVFAIASYALFLLFFYVKALREAALNGGRGPNPDGNIKADVWSVFAAITLLGGFLLLSNVGVSVSVERDWITSIAQGSTTSLTRLNAIMRRIDLLSKLLAPLGVALFTSTVGYPLSCVVLLGISAVSVVFELIFIGIVFRRFPVLQSEEAQARLRTSQSDVLPVRQGRAIVAWLATQVSDWRSFIGMPVFVTSLAIALLYMSVLSFDSTFIAYLKAETTYSDAFIAGMRALCVVTGLLGTFVSPLLTKRIGLIRTGTWSIWSEFIPLCLCIVSFYVGTNVKARPTWNSVLLFTGLSLSRVGLWSFDLCQLTQIQLALGTHPRRNALMGLQFALQNCLDLLHYTLTIIWSKPNEFRNAADVSYGAIGLATLLYTFGFARKQRGHLLHVDAVKQWFKKTN